MAIHVAKTLNMDINKLLLRFNNREDDNKPIILSIYDEYEDRNIEVLLEGVDTRKFGFLDDNDIYHENSVVLWGQIYDKEPDDKDVEEER